MMKKYAVIVIDKKGDSTIYGYAFERDANDRYVSALNYARPQDGDATVMLVEVKQAYDGLEVSR